MHFRDNLSLKIRDKRVFITPHAGYSILIPSRGVMIIFTPLLPVDGMKQGDKGIDRGLNAVMHPPLV